MSNQNIITEIKKARIERILTSKQSRLLTSSWMRRTLSIIAIISSYTVLATLLIPTPYTISKTNRIYADYELMSKNWIYDARDITQGAAILLLIWSFVLLRISMRRVTLLPDEYLDELQITNRDWAFKTGYLVVRRIGLGVAIVFGLLATLGNYFLVSSGQVGKFFSTMERYVSDLSTEDPFGFYLKAFLLLAFVAYSFPIILLAWREARFPENIPVVKPIKELNEKESAAKFYFGAIRFVVVYLAVYLSLSLTPKLFMAAGSLFYALLLPLLYIVIPGALMLFVWASVTVARGVKDARKTGFKSEEQKRWANITTGFLAMTLALGIFVGFSMFAVISGLTVNTGYSFVPVAFLTGLLMIPTQAASMLFYAKLDSK